MILDHLLACEAPFPIDLYKNIIDQSILPIHNRMGYVPMNRY